MCYPESESLLINHLQICSSLYLRRSPLLALTFANVPKLCFSNFRNQMASSILDLGKTEHDFPNRGLKLLIRSTIHVTFPQSSVSCQSSQELITAGFWIMRGNGLNLSIRIGFGLPVGPQTGRENFSNGLIDVLCAAKVVSSAALFGFRGLIEPSVLSYGPNFRSKRLVSIADQACWITKFILLWLSRTRPPRVTRSLKPSMLSLLQQMYTMSNLQLAFRLAFSIPLSL